MWQWISIKSNSKRMPRILIILVISIIVVITYTNSGFDNNNFVNYLKLPKRNSTNLNKTVYKHIINASVGESDHSLAFIGNKSLAEILKQKSKTINQGEIISNKNNLLTDRSRSTDAKSSKTKTHYGMVKETKLEHASNVTIGNDVSATEAYRFDDPESEIFPMRDISRIQPDLMNWNRFKENANLEEARPISKWSKLYRKQNNKLLKRRLYIQAGLDHFNKSAYDIMSMICSNDHLCDRLETLSNLGLTTFSFASDDLVDVNMLYDKALRAALRYFKENGVKKQLKSLLFDNKNSIAFHKAYKNPCWRGDGQNGPFKDGNLHCLPYFYLIGVKKSGTTDFMSRLKYHPEYCMSPQKESQWFARRRFGIRVPKMMYRRLSRDGYDIRKVEAFSSMFDRPTHCIISQPSTKNISVTYRRVVADASPSTFHMHTKWELLPGNENLTEPRYTNFHYIKHLTPDVKIIVLFRDPSTRLYSDFLFTTRGHYGVLSPTAFHDQVLQMTSTYKDCFSHSTERSCVYNNTLKNKMYQDGLGLYSSFNAGFYAVFMKDMLSVFGKDQVLPIFMPDYITKMAETLRRVFAFLEMDDVSEGTMRKMLSSRTKNVSKRKEHMPMLNATRKILYDFYRPYNERMATLVNDSRYLFLHS